MKRASQICITMILCLFLVSACATIAAVRTDATPKERAQAICSDLQTATTATSGLLAWTTIYFPNQKDLLDQAAGYLSLAEESRATACEAIDLVTDATSLQELIGTRQNEVFGLIARVQVLIQRIKGEKTASLHPYSKEQLRYMVEELRKPCPVYPDPTQWAGA